MVDQRLVEYIKAELYRGLTPAQIKQTLVENGWPVYEINEAFNLINNPKPEEKTTSNSLKTEQVKEKSNTVIIILVVGVLIVGGVFGFVLFSDSIPFIKPNKIIDCQNDMQCFIQASKNCKPSNVTHDSTIGFFGILITTKSYYEIKGLENNKCVFYIRNEKINVNFSDELVQQILDSGETQEKIDQELENYNSQYDAIEGRDGTCKFNSNDLAEMLTRWKDGKYSLGASCKLTPEGAQCESNGDWSVAEDCQGSYFNQEL
ncbi:MAG: hypothetical protein QXF88_02435 [Candidatus Aenigmatarchaeota archaeon]